MKKLFTAIALFIGCTATAQKMPSDYFDEGGRYYEEKKYDEAVAAYRYIVDNHPRNELYPRSVFNIACIYHVQKKYELAIAAFKKILAGSFNEQERRGGSIMDDPYMGYRHNSSDILSRIYYEQEKYDSSLHYLILADKVHPYQHFCGNELEANELSIALRYADLYQKLHQPDKAIESLLPVVFITLADNDRAISSLKRLLKQKKNVKKDLDAAINAMYAKSYGEGENAYKRYYFKFFGAEIYVPQGYEDEKKEFDKAASIKTIHESDFYKMIEKL